MTLDGGTMIDVPVQRTLVSGAQSARKGLGKLLRPVSARVGMVIVATWVVIAVVGPYLIEAGPNLPSADRLAAPSFDHFFGTDRFGRDMFARVVHGARLSLVVGFVAVGISAAVGSVAGLVSGYFGGLVDAILMRLVEVMLAFPVILLALVIITILGPGIENLVLAVGIAAVPQYARLVRGAVLAAKERPYVDAARVIGGGHMHLMFHHILRNVSAPIVVLTSLNAADAIVVAAGLSFLGLGVQPPTAEWGQMLSDGRNLMQLAWWLMAFPGLALVSVTLALNLLGDGLRQSLDPRLRRL